MSRLQDKVAIVTGGGQGIGRGISLAFAKEGAKVVIAEINPDTAKAVEQEIRQLGKIALAITCNVGDEAQVKATVARTVSEFGPVDILVNNAYGGGRFAPLEEQDEESFNRCYHLGPVATWYCMKAVFPYMKGRGGKIINFGTGVGIRGAENMGPYAAAKEAIRGLSRVGAREWGRYKINVNVICPSAVTPAMLRLKATQPEGFEKKVRTPDKPIDRLGDPEMDIGRAAVFLASSDSDFVTGQTLMVSGGSHMF